MYRIERPAERGQVLPMWTVGVIASLAIVFYMVNYAQTVRYQIRAQNDADAAALGMVAAQTQMFNQMEMLLYAANVEEYRIRYLLDGMLLAVNRSGGCNGSNLSSTTAGTCNRVYQDLKAQFQSATYRYTNDIIMLDSITGQTNKTEVLNSAAFELSGNDYWCNNPDTTQQSTWTNGGDCNAKVTVDAVEWRTGLFGVNHDATTTVVPGLGRYDSIYGLDTENQTLFAPLAMDVVACIAVPPVIPNIGPYKWPTYYVVGRAAVTAAQTTQDFLQPGAVCDPAHTSYGCGGSQYAVFQPPEDYTPSTVDPVGINWYEVYYGGNSMTANAALPAYQGNLYVDEFSAMMGWWGAVPIRPFGPAVTRASAC